MENETCKINFGNLDSGCNSGCQFVWRDVRRVAGAVVCGAGDRVGVWVVRKSIEGVDMSDRTDVVQAVVVNDNEHVLVSNCKCGLTVFHDCRENKRFSELRCSKCGRLMENINQLRPSVFLSLYGLTARDSVDGDSVRVPASLDCYPGFRWGVTYMTYTPEQGQGWKVGIAGTCGFSLFADDREHGRNRRDIGLCHVSSVDVEQ